MTAQQRDVQRTIRSFLTRVKKRDKISLDTSLYAEGIGLDSVETAELSQVLEDELGSDPFSDGQTPETIGDIVSFYEKGDAEKTDA